MSATCQRGTSRLFAFGQPVTPEPETERLRIRFDFVRRAPLATGMDTGPGQVVANARCSMNGWRDRASTSAVMS
jgi:hypothetical protein